MFKPHRITDGWKSRVESTYRAGLPINAGALVDIDTADTSGQTSSQGFGSLIAGSLKLATIATAAQANELGICVVNVVPGGLPLEDRVLGLTQNYMMVPEGLNAPIYKLLKGDVVGTTEFVGNLAGDSSLPGYLDTTNTANFNASCGIFNGRFRIQQGSEKFRARFVGTSTQGGALVALFEIQ